MPKIKFFFVAIVLTVSFSNFANGQGAVSYKFLEVIDYENQPVADATVNVQASCQDGEQKTDQKGHLERGFPIGFGDCQTRGFNISKEGFYKFTDIFGVLQTITDSDENNPTKVELLKIPTNKTEKDAVEQENLKREFFVAARSGDIPTIRKFLKKGFSPNITTSDLRGIPGYKAVPIIIFAVESRNFHAVNEFLSVGVNVRKIPDILISYLNANPFMGSYGESDEMTKRKKIYEDGLEVLAKKGADINAKGTNGMMAGNGLTTLMIASYHSFPRTVKFLIDQGVPINSKDELARTALIHAVVSPYLKTRFSVIESSLEAGANPNVVAEDASPRYSSYCESPLMYAVLNTDVETIKLLIEHKTNVNLGCKKGGNPLSIARELKKSDYPKNADEIIKILTEAGAKE